MKFGRLGGDSFRVPTGHKCTEAKIGSGRSSGRPWRHLSREKQGPPNTIHRGNGDILRLSSIPLT